MPVDTSRFEARRRQIDQGANEQLQRNTFDRNVGQQRFARNTADRRRSFGRQYGGVAAGFGRRGLAGPGVQSGVHQNAMQQFVGDFARDQGYAQQDQDFADQNYVNSGASIEAARRQALADLEIEKQNAIAQAALEIAAARPQYS